MRYTRKRYLLAMIPVAVTLATGLIGLRLYRPPALYRMTILPSLDGWRAEAYSLNDHGQVAGVEYVGTDQYLFLWDRMHGMQNLGPVTGDPLAINNAGQIGGTMPIDPNHRKAFLWEPGKGRTVLGTLGGKISIVEAMNDRGQIVGLSHTAGNSVCTFLWDREKGMRELTAPDGSRCGLGSINGAGQILVMPLKTPRPPDHWFMLDANGLKLCDAIPADTWPRSMNANSWVAGIGRSNGLSCLLLRDERGTWRRLFTMNSHGETTRLNDRNQIAYTEGVYSRWEQLRDRLPKWLVRRRFPSHETESYLWDSVRGRIPLNRYLVGMKQFRVVDLNNNGCIIGTAKTEGGRTRSVLLEPIPEHWGK